MRIAILLFSLSFLAGCAHVSLEESWPRSKLSECDRQLTGDWTRLDSSPAISKSLLAMVEITKEPRNTIWYEGSDNRLVLCLRVQAPGCENSTKNNGNAIGATTGPIYEFEKQGDTWTVTTLTNEVGSICVSGG